MIIPYDKIIEHYDYLTPLITEKSKENVRRWVDPYTSSIDWMLLFTPIEMATWNAIRCFGVVPLYPQYPVGRKFIDFGNPYLKIGIECDGKKWHEDVKADIKRDTHLNILGWTLFHVPGWNCFRTMPDLDDYVEQTENDKESWLNEYYATTMDGVLKAIAIRYFGYQQYAPNEKDIAERHLNSFSLLEKMKL